METKIFVNLPVKDLEQSKQFFQKIGFSINPQFSDHTGACVVISDDIYAMILTHDKFREFTPKAIADSTRTSEVLTALSAPSKEKVDSMMMAAIDAGGSEARPVQDLGFMYSRAFNDPDGHIWELFWMDMNAMPQG